MKNKTKLIIFDFDGVLADSFDTFYPMIRDGMKQIGLSFTKKQYRDLFIVNVHQGFKNFIKNEGKYLKFKEFRDINYDKYYYDKKLKVKLFPKVTSFIKKLSTQYKLAIASSGKKDNIRNLLRKKRIANFFSLILADSSHSKNEMIIGLLNKFRVKPGETFMITDTVGDIKVAKKLSLKTIAVTWGFHSPKLLITAKPNYVVRNFKNLEHILK